MDHGRDLPAVASGLVTVLAALALVAWVAHLDGVMSFLPGSSFIKANGALAMLLVASALFVQRRGGPSARRQLVVALLAMGSLAVAVMTSAEWLTGIDVGIDQLLVHDWTGSTPIPGRPSLTGAIAVGLLATAILARMTTPRLARFRDAAALLVLAFGLLSLVGWLTGVTTFVQSRNITPASVLMSAGLGLCALSLFWSGNPATLAMLTRRGPAGTLARRLAIASVAFPLVLGAIASAVERIEFVSNNVGQALMVVGMIFGGGALALVAASVAGRTLDDLAASADALEVSERRQRMVIENMPQAIIFKDLDGVMLSANPSVRAQLGMEPADLIGKRLVDLGNLEAAETYAAIERQVIATREPATVVNHVALPSGTRTLEIRNIPAFDDRGDVMGVLLVVSDVTAQLESQRSRRLLAAIVDSADEAITSGDTNGLFTSWNGGAERMYGWTAEEAIGASRSIIVPPEFLDQTIAFTNAAIAGSDVRHTEAVRMTRDGTRIDVSLTVSGVLDAEDKVVGYSMIARNIGAQKRAQAQLEGTRQELERSNSELQDFASVASHDLQEPLRKIRAFGDRLMRRLGETADPESRGDVARIQDAASRMQQLIEDLLTYARVTSRAKPFAQVDLKRAVNGLLLDLETSIAESGGQVSIGALPTLDADASQMGQLFQNLIGNALKFHPADRPPIVTVAAEAVGLSVADGMAAGWRIDVADNGIGLEPRFAERIFAPFERLHSRAEFPGTGIGLAICRKIAARHGGTITVSSVPGSGTTFHVFLPAVHLATSDVDWRKPGHSMLPTAPIEVHA